MFRVIEKSFIWKCAKNRTRVQHLLNAKPSVMLDELLKRCTATARERSIRMEMKHVGDCVKGLQKPFVHDMQMLHFTSSSY